MSAIPHGSGRGEQGPLCLPCPASLSPSSVQRSRGLQHHRSVRPRTGFRPRSPALIGSIPTEVSRTVLPCLPQSCSRRGLWRLQPSRQVTPTPAASLTPSLEPKCAVLGQGPGREGKRYAGILLSFFLIFWSRHLHPRRPAGLASLIENKEKGCRPRSCPCKG